MSANEQTPLSQPTSVMRNTLGREQAPQNLVRPVSDEDLREYCDKNYHQILPIIAEKLHQEKAQQKPRTEEETSGKGWDPRKPQPVAGGIVTLQSSRVIPLECLMVSEPGVPRSAINQVKKEKIQVASHPEHLEQTVAIGSIVTEEGQKDLCGLLRRHLDVFAWKPTYMTGVPRHIAEHRLNVGERCLPVRKRKRGQAPERNKAISEEVKKLVEADIIKEVHYHSWLSNQLMVKKHDDSWRMCVDFKDLNKACPKDGYPLPKIDWKVESLCGYPYKCFSNMYKGYHQIKMAEEDEKKMAFITSQGIFIIQKCRLDLKTLEQLTSAAAKEAIGVVLMTERDGKQVPIYFVSRALQGPEINYTPMEKLILALVSASKRLKRYFQAHTIVVITDQPINQLLSNPKVTGRLLKWRFELEEHDIQYRPRTSIKGQILANFIMERPEDGAPDTPIEDMEELPDPWILFTNGSSCVDGSGDGLIIMNLEGMEFTYALRYLEKVKNLANTFKGLSIKQIPRGKNKKANTLSKIASTSFAHLSKQVLVEELKEKAIDKKEILAVVEEEGHTWMTPVYEYLMEGILPEEKKKARTEKLTPITSPWPFYKWGIDVAGPFPEGPDKVKFLIVAIDYFTKWIEARPVETITGTQAHRIMIKSSNGETPFSLTYGADAVIQAEIGMPTLRTTEVDMAKNNKSLGISFDLLEEKREQAAIQEARNKAKMKGYYNVRVRSTSFRPGDFVYQNNEASHAEDEGKLRPKWEGPYEVIKALGKGAYRLRNRNGHTIPRTWNICNLKKCYMHEM
uniref:Reverse transcriptase domain-containing protein n=1 Tax=Tanacetum cinerariifolium TaxID=118510 RepID=A0A699HBI7_TANCI|nr:reverse transcriptase domain-containing protein [Tanacetum cinerariifolium]